MFDKGSDIPSVNVVIPTRNEEANISKLLSQIMPYGYGVIVVDDSDDATADIAISLGARVVKGQRKGLGQAIIDGINASNADVVVVMDSDLSHDPKAIPSLLKPILEQGCDLVIGSRYVRGGDYSNWALNRKIKSIIGVKLMQLVTGVRDSNSGFFALRKSILDGIELKPFSWKIMLEVLFRGKWISKQEVPITFNDRVGGVSKNNVKEKIRQAKHLLRLLAWKWGRFINFALVGGIGALWYFAILYFLTEYASIWYGFSAIMATLVAITNNYLINHYYTFRHVKQYNKSLFSGWLKYCANSAIGDGVDWCVMIFLTEVFGVWYMLSAFLASGVACIIKYAIASKFIWGKKGKGASDPDYEWHAFYKGLPWQKLSKQRVAKTVREFAGVADTVLDIGSASSPAGLLVEHSKYVGMDIDKGKIEYMRAKGLEKAQFDVGSVLNLPYSDNCVDVVLFMSVIEHLNSMDEVHKGISEIARVLRPSGKVVITTPDFGSAIGKLQEKLYGIFQPKAYADQHKVMFDANSLAELCRSHGFVLDRSGVSMGRDLVMGFRKES